MFFKRNVALLGYMFVPLKFRARMTWFLETVLLPRQLLLASLMHLSCKHLTFDEEYAVGSCLVEDWGGRLRNGAAPVPLLTESARYGKCSA